MENQILTYTGAQASGFPILDVAQAKPASAARVERPFLSYINYFRAVAILLIVALHCYSIIQSGAEPYLLRRATLPFMFISGFLFQYLSGKFTTPSYLKKKLKNVVVPYLVVSTPVIIARIAASSHSDDIIALIPNFLTLPVLLKALAYYCTGLHLVPLWFIPMMCFYYLLGPVFAALDRNGKVYYFLPLFLGLSLLVTRAPQVYKIHLAFVHYLSVYLLGMFVSRNSARILRLTDKIWPLVAVLVVISLSIGDLFSGAYSKYIEQFLFIQKLILCWGFMYGFWKFDKYVPKQLKIISEMSFGIFFLHYYLLFALVVADYKGYIHLTATFTSFCLIFVADLAFCLLVLHLLKKVFGSRSRTLVGY